MAIGRKKLALITVKDLAFRAGIPYQLLMNRIKRGQFPAPTVRVVGGRRAYYAPDEAQKLIEVYGLGDDYTINGVDD